MNEYRGGPLATARLLLDCYVRPDQAWKSIEPSQPGDQPPPNLEATDAADVVTGEAL